MSRLTPEQTFEEARLAQERGDWEGFFACFDRVDLLAFSKHCFTALMRDPATLQELCRKASVPRDAADAFLQSSRELSELARSTGSGVPPREGLLRGVRQTDRLLLTALKSAPDLTRLTADAERAMRRTCGGGSVSSRLFGGETVTDVIMEGSRAWAVRVNEGRRSEVGFVRKRGRWYIRLRGRIPSGLRKPAVSAVPPLTRSLERIGRWLQEHARPSYDALRPGLSAGAVRARLEPLASHLSQELLELYQWRDGQESGPCDFIPGLRLLPLEEAIHERELLRRAERELAAMMPGQPRHNWLPVIYFEGNGSMAELGGDSQLTAVVDHDMEDPGLGATYSSLAAYMAEVAERFESGAYFVTAEGLLEADPAAVKAIHLRHYPDQS